MTGNTGKSEASITVNIDGRAIGEGQPPYIIAELSANHMGDQQRALDIVKAAADAGAEAVKLQTYTADSITIDCDRPEFLVRRGPRAGSTLYQVYSEGSTPWEWHESIFEYGRELGVSVFSSPFDFKAVDALETLNAPAYKIASCELVDLPLIRYVAQTGKPLIISTGMATLDEITEAVTTAQYAGCNELVLMHCISGYPTPADQAHLHTIGDLKHRFGIPIGFSDHTEGVAVSLAAVSLGAAVIEKHLTLSRDDGGLDASFSLEPGELENLCRDAAIIQRACGSVHYGHLACEVHAYRNRRSLYVVEDMQTGEAFTSKNVRSIRPAAGLAPRHLDKVIGRKAVKSLKRGTPVSWEIIADE